MDAWKTFYDLINSPAKIQLFLSSIDMNMNGRNHSPIDIPLNQQANSLEGAVFAAAALENLGFAPLVVHFDSDHTIAVYKIRGKWGSISKASNKQMLSRDPVYMSLRELVMSYYEFHTDFRRNKLLRSYTSPIDMRIFDLQDWRETDEDIGFIKQYLCNFPHIDVDFTSQDMSSQNI